MEGLILSFKREPIGCCTNIWLVRFRVKIHGKLEDREKHVTGIAQAHNDGQINMEAALAVAASYGGKRIRILSTKFIDSGVKAGHDYQIQKEHWEGRGSVT